VNTVNTSVNKYRSPQGQVQAEQAPRPVFGQPEQSAISKSPAPLKKKAPPPPPPAKKLPTCRALYDYEAREADEMSIRTGEVITVIKKGDDGWWHGSLGGLKGMFPSNYVEEMN
jgi:myosin-1